MTVRLFAAVVPPASVVDALDQLVGPRREADERLRWMTPDTWHVTTLFAEAVPEDSIEPLLEALGEVAAGRDPFEISLNGGGAFPDPATTRNLHLRVDRGAESTGALARSCRATASRVGVAPDGTKFVPHLTLARTRTRFDSSRWLGILDSFGSFDWEADALVVHESIQHRRGGHTYTEHRVLQRCPFGVDGASSAT